MKKYILLMIAICCASPTLILAMEQQTRNAKRAALEVIASDAQSMASDEETEVAKTSVEKTKAPAKKKQKNNAEPLLAAEDAAPQITPSSVPPAVNSVQLAPALPAAPEPAMPAAPVGVGFARSDSTPAVLDPQQKKIDAFINSLCTHDLQKALASVEAWVDQEK